MCRGRVDGLSDEKNVVIGFFGFLVGTSSISSNETAGALVIKRLPAVAQLNRTKRGKPKTSSMFCTKKSFVTGSPKRKKYRNIYTGNYFISCIK